MNASRISIVSLLFAASTAWAQDTADPMDDAPQSPEDVLKGPDVPETKVRTLITRGMSMGFQRVQGRPEAAAAVLLELDEQRAIHIREIVEERERSVMMLIVDRIDEFREMSDATRAGDREKVNEMMREFYLEFAPGAPRDPLMEQLAGLLTQDEQAEVKRILDEYWDAWIDSALRGREANAQQREQVRRRLSNQLFNEEFRQAYQYGIKRYADALEGMYVAVEPTSEQREMMRDAVIEHIRTTRLSPTPDQRQAAMLKIYRNLDEERKEKLFLYMTQLATGAG